MQRGLPIFPLHIDRNTRSKQYLDNTNLSFPRCRVQQDSAVGTGSEQSPCHVHMTRSRSRVQRGLTICPLRINWDTSRKQNLRSADMARPSSRVQRSPAAVRTQVGPGALGEQNLYDAGVPRPGSRVQRGLPIFHLRINRDTSRKQNLDNTALSLPRCRVQQGTAIDTSVQKNLCDPGVS